MLSSFLSSSEYFSIFIIDTIGVLFALWIFFDKKRDKVNKGLCLMIITILSWITFYYLASLPKNPNLSLFLFRISGASVFLFFVTYYFFTVRWFLRRAGIYRLLGKIIFIYGFALFFLTLFTNYIIVSPEIDSNEVLFPLFSQIGATSFYGFVVVLTALINIILLRSYFASEENRKLKIQYFLTGMLLFATLNFIFNVVLPVLGKNYSYYQIGNYSTLLLIGFTSYAVIKQKLFGVRVIFTQLLVGGIALLLVVDFISANSVLQYIFKGTLTAVFVFFGILLIRSVKREIEQKEQIDRYATQLALTNKKLEEAYKKVKKLDKAKSEFIYIASHQLRTPLTAIKGYISMLLEGDYGKIQNQEQEKVVENVFSANERIIALVNSLLNLSRLESGKIKLNKEKVNLEELLEQLVKDFQQQARNKNLALSFEMPKVKIKEIEIDREKIREVVSNLIDN
ncbi:MAG: histidine kinase dimerization/phospho-acceptor domain-containing protein, partial [bacterium]|nr:histidine kinase dimerization/phospho-acceptor domain-containing protein [bacterium]